MLIFYITKGNQSVFSCNVSDGVRWDIWKHIQKLSWWIGWADKATREPSNVNTWSSNSVTITIFDTSSTIYNVIRYISIDTVIFFVLRAWWWSAPSIEYEIYFIIITKLEDMRYPACNQLVRRLSAKWRIQGIVKSLTRAAPNQEASVWFRQHIGIQIWKVDVILCVFLLVGWFMIIIDHYIPIPQLFSTLARFTISEVIYTRCYVLLYSSLSSYSNH